MAKPASKSKAKAPSGPANMGAGADEQNTETVNGEDPAVIAAKEAAKDDAKKPAKSHAERLDALEALAARNGWSME